MKCDKILLHNKMEAQNKHKPSQVQPLNHEMSGLNYASILHVTVGRLIYGLLKINLDYLIIRSHFIGQ